MRTAILAGALALAVLRAVSALDVIVGGRGEAETSVLLDPGDVLGSELAWKLTFAPRLTARSQSLSLAAEADLVLREGSGSPELTLRELELRWDPLDAVGLRVGRFAYLPGASEVASPVNYFSRTSLEALVSGRTPFLPTDLLQITMYWRKAFLRLSASPAPLEPTLPDPLSPWFPRLDIPSSITVGFPSQQTLVLGAITAEDALSAPRGFRGVSVSAELGVTLAAIDLSALYYHGTDNTPLVLARLSFPQGLYQSYDVIIRPLWRSIDAVGLSAVASYGVFRAWADASFVFARTLLTGRLSIATMETQTVTAPAADWAVGMSVEPRFADLVLLLEWKSTWTDLPDGAVVHPLLDSIVAAAASFVLGDRRLTLRLSSASSTRDWSTVVAAAASWTPQEELELELSVPVFLGAPDTELGQFGGNHAVWLRMTWKV